MELKKKLKKLVFNIKMIRNFIRKYIIGSSYDEDMIEYMPRKNSWHIFPLFTVDIWSNPFKTYQKVKDIFKFPKIKFFIGKNNTHSQSPLWKENIGLLFGIYAHDVEWKDKFNSPRLEEPPLFKIVLFRHLSIGFLLTQEAIFDKRIGKESCETTYWESILNYLYYAKGDLKEIIKYPYRSFRILPDKTMIKYYKKINKTTILK